MTGAAASRTRIEMTLAPMAAGWPGIEASLRAMQGNVERRLFDARVREGTMCVLHAGGAKGGDRVAEARAIYRFVEARVEYRRDPAWLELIQDPVALLAHVDEHGWAAGDCDDHAQLAALMGFQVRLPIDFVLAAREREYLAMPRPALLEAFARAYAEDRPVPVHVYAAMREDRWAEPSPEWLAGDDRAYSGLISLDTARPGCEFGEHAPGLVRYVRPAVLTP